MYSTETYTFNMQHLQMSGLTNDEGNIFGNRAAISTTNQSLIQQPTSKTASTQNLISPVNSDLAGVPGSENLIIDLQV